MGQKDSTEIKMPSLHAATDHDLIPRVTWSPQTPPPKWKSPLNYFNAIVSLIFSILSLCLQPCGFLCLCNPWRGGGFVSPSCSSASLWSSASFDLSPSLICDAQCCKIAWNGIWRGTDSLRDGTRLVEEIKWGPREMWWLPGSENLNSKC